MTRRRVFFISLWDSVHRWPCSVRLAGPQRYTLCTSYAPFSFHFHCRYLCDAALLSFSFQLPSLMLFNHESPPSLNWQLIAHACASLSTRIATAHDSLGPAGLTHSLNEPSCAAVFTNATLLPTVLAVLPDTPSVKFVLFDGEVDAKLVTKLREVRGDVQVFSVAELREKGQK
ncbi:hypothetical protein C8R45DRAFT_873114, partial [Mycena sanguinolenta]